MSGECFRIKQKEKDGMSALNIEKKQEIERHRKPDTKRDMTE